MTDLRKAVEELLYAYDKDWLPVGLPNHMKALRQALAQPEQEHIECMCGICKLGKREWVGITKEDKKEILEMTQPNERGYVIAITEAKLKEKNL